MIFYSNAKINLGLEIISKREDGLHNINSFFLPIPTSDVIEIKKDLSINEKCLISYSGFLFENNSDDLILKAYNLLSKDHSLSSIKVHLHKNIPIGSGLGGGSSNASHMLIALNQFFDLNLDLKTLLKYASLIGSDCPFFIYNCLSHVTGNGSSVKPITFNMPRCYLVIIKPNFNISTSDIFSNFCFDKKSNKSLVLSDDINQWKNNLYNDLESVAFSLFPELKDIKIQLYNMGANFASMTGSGSSIYGFFNNKPSKKIFYKNYWIWEGYI